MVLETKRLYLRKMNQGDYDALCRILQDPEVMYAYEHAFSDEEVQDWLDRQIRRYEKYGFGLWAVILKENEEMIGQCGLTMQDAGGREVVEAGYLSRRHTGIKDMPQRRPLHAGIMRSRNYILRKCILSSETTTFLHRMWQYEMVWLSAEGLQNIITE